MVVIDAVLAEILTDAPNAPRVALIVEAEPVQAAPHLWRDRRPWTGSGAGRRRDGLTAPCWSAPGSFGTTSGRRKFWSQVVGMVVGVSILTSERNAPTVPRNRPCTRNATTVPRNHLG